MKTNRTMEESVGASRGTPARQRIIDTVEYANRKDKDAANRRAKCARWGLKYIFGQGEEPVTPPAPAPPPA